MRITRKRTWPELRDAVVDAARLATPGTDFEVSGPDDPPMLTWTDGPSSSSISAALASPSGWTVVFWPDVLPAPTAPDRRPLLLLHRRFSEAALALAVCRFAGSNTRPFDSANPAHHAPMTAILDVDDPATCDYPLVTRMAELLLETPRQPDPPPNPADRLSRTLAHAGYDTLWNRAWRDVAL